MSQHADSAEQVRSLNVLFVGGYDSTNYVYVELIREMESRGHVCTVVVDDPRDDVNNKMFERAGIPVTPLVSYPLSGVRSLDVAFTGQFIRRPQRRLFAALAEEKVYTVSFANLFSAVTMRVPVDLVMTTSESKFDEFDANGLRYSMLAVGNPQYDPLVRARESWKASRGDAIRDVLIVDQGAYPFGRRGKEQLASTLKALAENNPSMRFHVKPRYLPGEAGEHLHSSTEHLYSYLAGAPPNLSLIREPTVLEELVLEHDAMVTTWSTAHLDAAVLGMPLLLIGGLDSADVFDVRTQRVEAAYRHLRETGCLFDWRQVVAGEARFAVVSDDYVEREFYDAATPSAPRVVDALEAVCGKLLSRGRAPRPGLRSTYGEFASAVLEDRLETVDATTARYETDRRYFAKVNAVIQELVFENRCMGLVLDMDRVRPFWDSDDASATDEIDRRVRELTDVVLKVKEDYFAAHSEKVRSDTFVQDAFFDWLLASGRHRQILAWEGPVLAPVSLEFNKGRVFLRRARLFKASKHFAESFSTSLTKEVRELRKDKHVGVVLSKPDRSLLAQAILLVLWLHGKHRALSRLDIPERPGVQSLVFYKMNALAKLGNLEAARALYREYFEAVSGATTTPRRRGLAGLLLALLRAWHGFAAGMMARRLGLRQAT